MTDFQRAFIDEKTWKEVKAIVDYMQENLQATIADPSRKTTHALSPTELLHQWQQIYNDDSSDIMALLEKTLEQSIAMHNPGNLGHQVGVPLPLAAACEFVSALMNNSGAIYEVGQVETVLERILIDWIAGLAGYDRDSAGGYFTNGGTIGNLTALLAARQVNIKGNIWKNGIGNLKPAVLVSEQSHYSIKRAAQIMGLGGDAVFPVACDTSFKMTLPSLQQAYAAAQEQGYQPFIVVANGCSTATGSFDPLEMVADFSEKHGLWFHVDGAHGFAVSLSEQHRHLVAGIERADSFVWDLHKMMLMPALTTAVIFRDNKHSYSAFAQDASYLFDENDEEPWFDLAHRTLECTKSMIAFKVFVALQAYGQSFFAEYINHVIGTTQSFAELINTAGDFEICTQPQFNIICYRYNPGGMSETTLNELQKSIRKTLLQEGDYYIVQTRIGDHWYLRSTIVNPLSGQKELTGLLDRIREIAALW